MTIFNKASPAISIHHNEHFCEQNYIYNLLLIIIYLSIRVGGGDSCLLVVPHVLAKQLSMSLYKLTIKT